MNVKEIGGEFALIDRLCAIIPMDHADLIAGVGDDAAVIRISPEPAPYQLVTTDILVEDQHFNRRWSTPEQIGIKSAECNISDIAAMGGRPTWMFISLVLTHDTDVAWAQKLYSGINQCCRRYGIVVAGGDTTRGRVNTVNITLLGVVSQSNLCLRSHARPGDLLMVTGELGASAAALSLLKRGKMPNVHLLQKHLAPTCRLDVVETIAPVANAMIDISDGLGSEVHHICRQSDVGAEIYAEAIPIHDDLRAIGGELSKDPLDFALSGGEDYELLFSISEDKVPILTKANASFHKVGKITEKNKGRRLVTADGKRKLPGGYDHFI
ncbi:MAG: thiamine-phosphate kinase [Desulfobacteraceae bacterium]|jgi:thiamine-monophosphate kinase